MFNSTQQSALSVQGRKSMLGKLGVQLVSALFLPFRVCSVHSRQSEPGVQGLQLVRLPSALPECVTRCSGLG